MKKNLVWFRNDLRIRDNMALYHACLSYEDEVVALFIDTPKQWKNHLVSIKKISFVHQNLINLRQELCELNIALHYYKTTDFLSSIEYLIYFFHKNKINSLFYNYQYEINEKRRDDLIKRKLSMMGIKVHGFDDNLLISHKIIKNQKNQTYKIFSFFKNKVINNLSKKIPKCLPIPLPRKLNKKIFFKNFPLKKNNIYFDSSIFPIGANEAIKKLKYFCINKEEKYSHNKNFPYLNSTSMLSPYLSSGVISIRYCLKIFLKKYKNIPLKIILNSSWINEIIWREFYYHLLIGFPFLCQSKALAKWEKNINWEYNKNHFIAWKNGKTGFPIVDAGMRQLNQIGWMHNRLRMIVANFLVKNLFINWREGEKYFMSQLIDGDFALNNGGWQWSASIGTDSVPYIRILNPFHQSKKFDQLGLFIKKYIPEISMIPNKYIHNPYEWANLNHYKIDYPKPIVNYEITRKKTFFKYMQAKLNIQPKKD